MFNARHLQSDRAASTSLGPPHRSHPRMLARTEAFDWARIGSELDAFGASRAGVLFKADECATLRALYAEEAGFRSRIIMSRHGFGRGEYRYFAYPLPPSIAALRACFYSHLMPIANRWQEALARPARFPVTHAEFIARCHAAGQTRPTPLLLRYGAGDYNCLHQDVYGAQLFPLQIAVLLSEPAMDFEGGAFVLTEQRPRQQSRVDVVPLRRGEAVIFAVNERPAFGTRGPYRVRMRHGVSRLRRGERYTLGLIFHDAT